MLAYLRTSTPLMQQIQACDIRSVQYLCRLPNRDLLTRISLKISFTADGWLYITLLPVIILIIKPAQAREYLDLAVTAFTLERLLYYLFKNTIKRQRPPAAIDGFRAVITASDRFSLPSGHTSAAFLTITFLCFAISPLFLPLYLWAASVGMSRIVLGVHFPSDILLGALLGSSIALIVV